MTDSGRDIDFMKSKMNELFAKLPPEARAAAKASIDVMRTAKTIEERDRLKDQELEKIKKLYKPKDI